MSADIARVTVQVPAKLAYKHRVESSKHGFTVNFNHEVDVSKIPQESIDYIFNYGFKQLIGDAHARATTQEEAETFAKGRLENVLAGTLGQRGQKSPAEKAVAADPVIAVLSDLFKGLIKKKLETDLGHAQPKATDKVARKEWDRALSDLVMKMNSNPKFRNAAEEEYARRTGMAEDFGLEDLDLDV